MSNSKSTEKVGGKHEEDDEDDDDDVVVLGTKVPPQTMNRATLPLSSQQTLVEQHAQMTIRFSASDIAAMAGCHPFKNMAQLLHRLVYQGRTGSLLLQMDAQALGLSLVATEEEIWKSLAAQAGPRTAQALDKVLTGKTSKTVPEAQKLKQDVVQKAKESGKLKPAELKVLAEGARHTVNTRFGTTHEDNALDGCERRFGWEILERNVAVMEWPFQKVERRNGQEFASTAEPLQDAQPCWKRMTRDLPVIETELEKNPSISTDPVKRQKFDSETIVVDLTDDGAASSTDVGGDNNISTNDQQEDSGNTEASFATSTPPVPAVTVNSNCTSSTDDKPSLATTATPQAAAANETKTPSLSQRVTEFVASPLVMLGAWLGKSPTVSRKRQHPEASETASDVVPAPPNPTKDQGDTSSPKATAFLPPKYDKDPFFVIRGAVDGIREELHVIPGVPPAAAAADKSGKLATNADEFGDDDDEEWVMRRIVVELKHRMNRIYHSPPLYEQIQAIAYCFMFKVDGADIVQVMRHQEEEEKGSVKVATNNESETKDPNATNESSKITKAGTTDLNQPAKQATPDTVLAVPDTVKGTSKDKQPPKPADALDANAIPSPSKASGDIRGWLGVSAAPAQEPKQIDSKPEDKKQQQPQEKLRAKKQRPLTIQADRISLDDPILQHRRNWHDVILPRLCSFADAVYTIRKDDSKRYRLLIACSDALGELERDAWLLLHEECPWMRSCDTAFNRR